MLKLEDLLTTQTRQIEELTNLIATQSETISQLQGDIEKINRRTKANERDISILKSLSVYETIHYRRYCLANNS